MNYELFCIFAAKINLKNGNAKTDKGEHSH